MISLTVSQICSIVEGEMFATSGDEVVTNVVADSSEVSSGSLFVAIVGERVDGHDYSAASVAQGAVAILAERLLDEPCIVVADSVKALGLLAEHVRQQLNCTVIAITGSSGKTSTKDLLANVLARFGSTIAPIGSFNTEVGVPLTMLRADESTRFLVLEMGMRGVGHIEYLCGIAKPSIGVLLNIGSAHMGMLGSLESLAQAKSEVIAGLPEDGIAVLNGDDPIVSQQASKTSARIVRFGKGSNATVRAVDVTLDEMARPTFTLQYSGKDAQVALLIHGEHFVSNAMAVAAVALEVGIPIADVAAALSQATIPSKWRMEVTQTSAGVTLINDSYNANPESMRAALDALAVMGSTNRTWAVLGEMLELGEDSIGEHESVARVVADLGISRLLCIGQGAQTIYRAALDAGFPEEQASWEKDSVDALAVLHEELRSGDIVLIKASRGIGLERVAAALTDQEAP
ncbi:MAG: UDP-N-acetylmuramoyl-tripeptide--D-alanyl-D-alanine ligase [Actinobacteria bacterium]|uniref:UDP-MurNAc-pentapeptide synthetase n=1 Tax=freshwater metagenome TaxID=449393 RepID=A0A6J7SIW3_9ZZZZ|nr:UDP-N-acetylmuramoyl-tripeptide--D-alanyl-D-alanine ligase [Actinomycetota bacterium]MTB28286.1 UDP-N-acetylmuramoyl-tripeptide--D-alanyl-D-alanine ligase [Actinomycetota bacterium]